eukprot:TRINITY_DN11153_c0_g1_i1.p1 TRINITY_DN11153_c0_g1~~TRINITY_DN11153_c0_g1_i1.p1  ORF type:complete len:386 (-),score=70.43 TRINITY_DN11153_c0_g1_i1:23-1075(-)
MASGRGSPFAPPDDWPIAGDAWGWRVGRRVSSDGLYFSDRYLYPPRRFQQRFRELRSKSQAAFFVNECLRGQENQNIKVEDFFALFQWKVPCSATSPGDVAIRPKKCKGTNAENGNIKRKVGEACNGTESETATELQELRTAALQGKLHDHNKRLARLLYVDLEGRVHESLSSSRRKQNVIKAKKLCPAGNVCCTLTTGKRRSWGNTEAIQCLICCTEPGFCGECCCILCGKATNQSQENWNYIKCEQKVEGELICGHVAHMECALDCNTAGVLTDQGLDVEYYCRRCDLKTDLMMHVDQLLNQSHILKDSAGAIKNMELALRFLNGTERKGGQKLKTLLELSLNKVILL